MNTKTLKSKFISEALDSLPEGFSKFGDFIRSITFSGSVCDGLLVENGDVFARLYYVEDEEEFFLSEEERLIPLVEFTCDEIESFLNASSVRDEFSVSPSPNENGLHIVEKNGEPFALCLNKRDADCVCEAISLSGNFEQLKVALFNMHRFLARIEGFLQDNELWGDEEQDLLEQNERILKTMN